MASSRIRCIGFSRTTRTLEISSTRTGILELNIGFGPVGAEEHEGGDQDFTFPWPSELVDRISKAAEGPGWTHEISSRIGAVLRDEDPQHVQSLLEALDYMGGRPDSGRTTVDEIFSPIWVRSDGSAYPLPLSSANEQAISVWKDSLRLFTSNDVLTARLHDLLWCTKSKPRPDLQARSAYRMYRLLWEHQEIDLLYRADALVRTLEISAELKDKRLLKEGISKVQPAIREVLHNDEWIPGVAFRMLEALAGLPAVDQPNNLASLMKETRDRYSADPFIVEAISDLEIQRAATPEARREIANETASMWSELARETGGILEISYLERALEIARDNGLSELSSELRVRLQEPRSHEDLGMESVGSEIRLPREEVERIVSLFVDTASPGDTLARLATNCPITDVDADEVAVREQMESFPLQYTFDTVITNEEGMPLAHLNTDDQKLHRALMQRHTWSVSLWGLMLTQIIERIRDTISAQEVEDFAGGDFADESVSRALSKAYGAIQTGDFDESLNYSVARIEPVLREVARTIGLAVYREPSRDGRSMGKYKGLGELLAILEGHVPETHRRYMSVLLTERLGLNVRNRWAHGLIRSASPIDCLLVWHVLLIVSRWTLDGTPPKS